MDGGKNVGWLVSRTTFSGHLRADAIRMAAAPVLSAEERRVRPRQPQDILPWAKPMAPAISAISIDP
jgi:hypothetical protein